LSFISATENIFVESNSDIRQKYADSFKHYKKIDKELGLNAGNNDLNMNTYKKNLEKLEYKDLKKLEEYLAHRKIVADLQTEPMDYYRGYTTNEGIRTKKFVSKAEDQKHQQNHLYVIKLLEEKITNLKKPKYIYVK